MSVLQDRFIRELKLRNLAETTIENYVSIVTKLCKLIDKPPLKLSRDDIAAIILHELTVEKLAPRTINLHIGCLKTFYKLMSPGSEVMKSISSMNLSIPALSRVLGINESNSRFSLSLLLWSLFWHVSPRNYSGRISPRNSAYLYFSNKFGSLNTCAYWA